MTDMTDRLGLVVPATQRTLGLRLVIEVVRAARPGRCAQCGLRRVLVAASLRADVDGSRALAESPRLCLDCAGLRRVEP